MDPDTTYDDHLATLSEASVNLHFDPFTDIDWEAPAHDVSDPADERFVLPTSMLVGAHPWYQALPLDRQVVIGLWTMAQTCRVGIEFENLLIRGLMAHAFTLERGNPEFRYVTHEATEECHHTQMFQEFVNRAGTDVPGLRWWVKVLHHVIPMFSTITPTFFFMMVLCGEEPVDHLQKHVLRASEHELHPLMRRIMQIHVAEEARHISFAHEYLARRAEDFGVVRRAWFSLLFPVAMRIAADLIAVPSRRSARELGIPRKVYKQLWWRGPESRRYLSDTFGDVRLLVERMGLMNRVSRRLWSALGVGGAASRYRGEIHDRSA